MCREKNTQQDVTPVLPRQRMLLLFSGLLAAMFMSTLDQTVVGTAMRTIADDLGGQSQQAWPSVAFLITSTVATPTTGRLSDLYGRRPVFAVCIIIFCLASLLCGMSSSMLMLTVCRAVQGIGGGGLVVLPMIVIADVLSPRQRAKYQGVFLAVISMATVIGPVLGGLFAGATQILWIDGWRWAFLINVPVAIVSLGLVIATLRYPQTLQNVRIDWMGMVMLVTTVVPLLLIAEEGALWGWTSATAFICYAIAIFGCTTFVRVERRTGDAALLPLGLFHDRTFLIASIIGAVLGFSMLGGLSLIPLYLQVVRGATPIAAGAMLLPTVAGMMIATVGAGQVISRTGRFGILPVLGSALLTGSLLALSHLALDTPLWVLFAGTTTFGVGIGLLMQTLTLISQNVVPLPQIGVATSTATFVRSIGGAFGAAIIIATVFAGLPEALSTTFSDQDSQSQIAAAFADPQVIDDPANSAIIGIIERTDQDGGSSLSAALSTDTSFLTDADPRLANPFLAAFTTTTQDALRVAGIVSILGFLLSLLLRPGPVRDLAAIARAAEERAKADASFSAPLIEGEG